MAKLQEKLSGETSDYLVTREFREHSTPEQQLALMRACYHIAAADIVDRLVWRIRRSSNSPNSLPDHEVR